MVMNKLQGKFYLALLFLSSVASESNLDKKFGKLIRSLSIILINPILI